MAEHKGFKINNRKIVGLLAPYENALATRPVLTKCATGGVLAFLGDLVAQRVNNVQKGELQFDERRLAAFTVRYAPLFAHDRPAHASNGSLRPLLSPGWILPLPVEPGIWRGLDWAI